MLLTHRRLCRPAGSHAITSQTPVSACRLSCHYLTDACVGLLALMPLPHRRLCRPAGSHAITSQTHVSACRLSCHYLTNAMPLYSEHIHHYFALYSELIQQFFFIIF